MLKCDIYVQIPMVVFFFVRAIIDTDFWRYRLLWKSV